MNLDISTMLLIFNQKQVNQDISTALLEFDHRQVNLELPIMFSFLTIDNLI